MPIRCLLDAGYPWVRLRLAVAACLVAAMLASTAASGTVLYDTADGAPQFSTGAHGWLVRDYRPTWRDATQFPAMPFQLAVDGVVESIELALTESVLGVNWVDVRILKDAGGLPSSEVVASLSTFVVTPGGGPFTYSKAEGHVLLEGGEQYWLGTFCNAPCQFAWWADPSNAAPGAIQFNSVFPYDLRWIRSESPGAMFRINGATADGALPVPGTVSLMAIVGAVCLVSCKARRFVRAARV